MKKLLFVLFFVFASSIQAQNRNSQAMGSDGERIEAALQSLVNGCFGDYAKYSPDFFPETFREPKYRAILSRASSPGRTIDGVKFELLARSVFDGPENLRDQVDRSVGRTSPIDIVLPDALPLNDVDSVIFAFTCTTALKLALEQGFKFNGALPGTASAGIKQALQVQNETGRKTSLALMYGVFHSPLSKALDPKDVVLRAQASAAIWSYYLTSDGQSQVNKNPKYLRSIKGWLMSRATSRELASMLGATTSVNASIFGFEANLSGGTKVTFNNSFSSADFTILLDDALDISRDFLSLPKPEELNRWIGSAAKFFPKDPSPYIKGKPTRLNATLYGIPPWMCNSIWSAKIDPAIATATVYAGSVQASGLCEVYADATIFVETKKLTLAFVNESFPIPQAVVGSRYISIENTYNLVAEAEPKPVLSADPIVSPRTDQINPTFGITVPFDVRPNDSVETVTWGSLPTVVCAGALSQPNVYQANKLGVDGSGQYSANMSVIFNTGEFNSSIMCNVNIPISIRYKGSAVVVSKDLGPFQLQFAPRTSK